MRPDGRAYCPVPAANAANTGSRHAKRADAQGFPSAFGCSGVVKFILASAHADTQDIYAKRSGTQGVPYAFGCSGVVKFILVSANADTQDFQAKRSGTQGVPSALRHTGAVGFILGLGARISTDAPLRARRSVSSQCVPMPMDFRPLFGVSLALSSIWG